MKKFLTHSLITPAFADSNHYMMIVDAGSSGSRLHIFKYEGPDALPVITDVFSENVKPGLSSYADHPENAGASLKKLLDDATDFMQKNGGDIKTTQLNILATAGMRLLPEDKQQAIYTNITNYLKNNYQFSVGNVETISGKMEGLYGWLDVNYLLDTFHVPHFSVGSIDMGGASTEITFATDDHSHPDDEISVKINNQSYTVFSKSFLGLGQDQALNAMSANQTASYCYPQHYVYNQTSSGNFAMTSCGTIYANIIQDHHVIQQMISTQNQPFVAFSGIYYTYSFFNADQKADQATLESKIQAVCNKPWEQLQQEYPDVPEKYLSTYCANGVYEDQLLNNAYKLDSSRLIVTNKIKQKDIDWTLGAALYRLVK
jgi:apyrase